MNFPLSYRLVALLVAALPSSASAFVTSFPEATFAPAGDIGAQIAGKDGWSIDDPYFDVNDNRGLSYSNILNTSLAAQLGGAFYVADPGASIFLSHAAPGELQYTSLSVAFAIQSSNFVNPGRDAFGFSFRDGGGDNLLTISLVPVASTNNDAYQVRYTVGANPTVNALDGNSDPMFIYHNGLYSLNLGFTPNGANPTFSATITGSNAQTFTGTATGLGASSVDRFGVEWNLDGDGANNGLIFDDLSVVPEPSSSLLLCLAGLGLACRRKRA